MATDRFAFTAARLAALPAPTDGRATYRDARCQGLTLTVSSTGGKVFYLYRRIAGRPRRVRLGRFPDLPVADARRAVQEHVGAIAAGRDPSAARRAAKNAPTLAEAFAHYLETHAKVHNRTWRGDERRYTRHLAAWGKRRLEKITTRDVAALHSRIGRTARYQANRVLSLLSVVWNTCRRAGLIRGANPCEDVKHFREQSRDRFLDAKELRRFLAALADEPDTDARDVFALCLLTGARRGNVQAMRWADLDLARGVWRIPETESKNAEPLLTILAPPAVGVLERRRREAGDPPPSPWVFPASRSRSGHLEEPKKAWAALVERAGLEGLRMHDLRRTLGSWQAGLGVSLPVIGRSLGHKSLQATQVYARLDLDSVRTAVCAATSAMLAVAEAPVEGQTRLLPAGPTPADGDVLAAQSEAAAAPKRSKGGRSRKRGARTEKSGER